MWELNPSSGIFGPGDMARLRAAYEAALTIASDEYGPFALMPGHALRRSLSVAIVSEARQGVTDVEQLKARALQTLSASLGMPQKVHSPEGAVSSHLGDRHPSGRSMTRAGEVQHQRSCRHAGE